MTSRFVFSVNTMVTLDSNWRWIHDEGYTNCYTGNEWDSSLCPDAESCADNCYLEGVNSDQVTPNFLKLSRNLIGQYSPVREHLRYQC